MKVVIQIPCLDEAESLPVTLAALPKQLPGVDEIEVLVIDDGSTDDTAAVAKALGVDQILRHPQRQGLARAFISGLGAAVERGADIIVNTDADNQYCADDIAPLIEPILAGRADLVIGARPIDSIAEWGAWKKRLQRLGSWVVWKLGGVKVADAPSGFRAISRRAALRMNVFSEYTYTLETILQAGQAGLAVESVPVRVNPSLRPSRLIHSTTSYVMRSIVTILRIFVTYRPFRFFVTAGALVFGAGILLGGRFLVLFAMGAGQGHIQSLILAAILLLIGFQLGVVGVLADLIAVNRKLLEDIQQRVRESARPDDR
jgi:glycosyltransferase involved in cell wall biosynthesis